MKFKDFQQLRATELAVKRYSSYRDTTRPSKRSVKSNGKGVGQVLKRSSIVHEVFIEKHFPKFVT